MRFDQIFLLHGKGGSPEGSVRQLEEILRRGCPANSFHRPRLLHADPNVTAEDSLADLRTKMIPPGSALIGISLGGLVAAKLQEDGRADLHVICISSPTWADALRVEHRMPNRVAFYSSIDEVIAGRTAEWPKLATAYDLPWLTHDTDAHKSALAHLVRTGIEGGDVAAALCELERGMAR
jgi:pimeloyl-ACP methyl ester carboxylesterase